MKNRIKKSSVIISLKRFHTTPDKFFKTGPFNQSINRLTVHVASTFISVVRSFVPINTLKLSIRNRAFRKHYTNRRNWKANVNGKHSEHRTFRKWWRHANHVICQHRCTQEFVVPVIFALWKNSSAVWIGSDDNKVHKGPSFSSGSFNSRFFLLI